jgi:primosomal protein N' (replication factor Y)
MSGTRAAEVILPLPISRSYAYRIPSPLEARAVPGARVVVPVRRRRAIGIVARVAPADPSRDLKDIIAAPDAEPALSPELLRLGQWMARYYGAPVGLAVRALLPGALWRPGQPEGPRETGERVMILTRRLPSLVAREEAFRRSPKRRNAYEALEALGGNAPVGHLVDQLRLSPSVLDGLVKAGLARIDLRTAARDPFTDLSSPPPPSLTSDQARVVAEIRDTPPSTAVLIHGVTGSGKTLVYLELVRRVVDAGGGAILLVPEIALTPQTVARVRGVFGDLVAVLHSGLSEGERADAWRALRRGERRVAVGPRSAVFAPVARLGAIVVDEEHETSYKQGTAPRYHARDVARVRAHLEGARLVLGSATPALETLHWGETGAARVFALPERIGARPLPPVTLVDLRSAPRVVEAGGVPWSERLDGAVGEALGQGDQVILLLNRRGFATFVQCPSCGDVRECPRCAIALTVHQTPPALRCHYCAHEEPVVTPCRNCGADTQRMRGAGTQRLEHFVAQRFPAARIARMDLDTTSTKWAHHRILERVARREVDILLGTQMIAKGLDFPGVTVVGVVDADTGLHLPDFRAAERTFQLVAQVAGRAGRGPKGGHVYVQTRTPAHHALTAAQQHSVRDFAAAELPLRAPPHPAYPPHAALARFIASAREEAAARAAIEGVAAWVRRASAESLGGVLTVLGPAPCPIARLKDRWRWHLLIKAAESRAIGRVVRAWGRAARQGPERGAAVVVDRDPVTLL